MTDEALKKKQPLEFWIEDVGNPDEKSFDAVVHAEKPDDVFIDYHVIEYSAYAETKQLLEEVQAKLPITGVVDEIN